MGNAWLKRPMRPVSIKDYYVVLKLFFDWLVREEGIDTSPMATLLAPIAHTERVRPFTTQQILSLVKATKDSVQPLRNEAIMWFLFDTDIKASELCNLRMKELDMDEQRCVVLGKGNKQRHIYFGKNTNRALRSYLRKRRYQADAPVFLGEHGMAIGKGLTRSGLLHMIAQLGRVVGIQAVRCSPHTFRHTFAIEFLRAGGNQFSLKELLGHTTLHMTNKYVALAQADIQAQHQKYSPVDRLMFGTSNAW
jgi:integrase/recombinase XerC